MVVFANQVDCQRSPLIESLHIRTNFQHQAKEMMLLHMPHSNMASICSDSNKQIQSPSLL